MSGAMATLAVDSRCLLGEGILWCASRGALYWTDIEAATLWEHAPASGAARHWRLPDRLACLAFGDDGRWLLGLAKGLYSLDIAQLDDASPLSPTRIVGVEEERADTRLNDGRADRHGNFVFGTKSERADGARVGAFYQYSARHGLRPLALPPAAIPNSICFDAAGRTLYYCDSADPRILCCDYDAERATVSAIRVFVELDDPSASPDGSIVDAEGCLWNAQWGAGRVVRYRGDGTIDRIVRVPAAQASCCTLGGPDGDRLYITTARAELDEDALARAPQAGGVFTIAVGASLARAEDRVRLP